MIEIESKVIAANDSYFEVVTSKKYEDKVKLVTKLTPELLEELRTLIRNDRLEIKAKGHLEEPRCFTRSIYAKKIAFIERILTEEKIEAVRDQFMYPKLLKAIEEGGTDDQMMDVVDMLLINQWDKAIWSFDYEEMNVQMCHKVLYLRLFEKGKDHLKILK